MKYYVLNCWMLSFEGCRLPCSLDVPYGGLGINELQFLINKILDFSAAKRFPDFWSLKP
jgi:hypothetical protein